MPRMLNPEGRLIVSELSHDEKVELILEAWQFLSQVDILQGEEFGPLSYAEADDLKSIVDAEPHKVWTQKKNISESVVISPGIEFSIFGWADLPYFLPEEEDPDFEILGYSVSGLSRVGAQGLYRDFYQAANPLDTTLSLSTWEKETGSWGERPYVWAWPFIACPFCEPLDDQAPVECPVGDPRLQHLASFHDETGIPDWSTVDPL